MGRGLSYAVAQRTSLIVGSVSFGQILSSEYHVMKHKPSKKSAFGFCQAFPYVLSWEFHKGTKELAFIG
jgi:hypothetical protein